MSSGGLEALVGWLVVTALSVGLLAICAAPAWADGEEPPPPRICCPIEPLLPVPEYGGRLCRRSKLSGDWCGTRRRWAEKGVFLDFDWTQVAQGVVDGGLEEGWAYGTNLDLRATLDLARLRLVRGAIVSFRAQSRFGRTVNGESGLILPVNTYGYFPFTDPTDEDVPIAITELNWTQMVSAKFGFLLGKITTMSVANEFAGGAGRTQFMNFQFVFPSVFAQIGPYSALAAGIVWAPSERLSVTSLLLNTSDASTTSGFEDFDDGQTWWSNATLTWRRGCKPGGVTVGGGYAFNGNFARIGGLYLDTSGAVSARRKSDSWAAFATGWQYLLTLEPPTDIDPENGRQDLRGLGVFAILGAGDRDTNPVQWSIACGLSGRGLIRSRGNDTCGLGYFYNELGGLVSDSLLDPLLQQNQGLEAYYTIALAGSIGLTLDGQWVDSGIRGVDDALLFGLRLNVDF